MNLSPETKLNNQSVHSYKSFPASSLLTGVSSPSDIICDVNENHGEITQLS